MNSPRRLSRLETLGRSACEIGTDSLRECHLRALAGASHPKLQCAGRNSLTASAGSFAHVTVEHDGSLASIPPCFAFGHEGERGLARLVLEPKLRLLTYD